MMARKSRIAAIILIFAIGVCFFSGCASMRMGGSSESDASDAKSQSLGISKSLRFEDLPVPAGFAMLRRESFIYQDGATRVGRIRYTGRPALNEVVRFYKDQMVLYNWDLQNVIDYEYAVLSFTKPDETCTITVMPLSTKTMLDIVLTPKAGFLSSGVYESKKKKY